MLQTAAEDIVEFPTGLYSSAPLCGAAPPVRDSWLIVVANRFDGG